MRIEEHVLRWMLLAGSATVGVGSQGCGGTPDCGSTGTYSQSLGVCTFPPPDSGVTDTGGMVGDSTPSDGAPGVDSGPGMDASDAQRQEAAVPPDMGGDVAPAEDVPVTMDVPMPVDVPVAMDVPVPVDVQQPPDVPVPVDVPPADTCAMNADPIDAQGLDTNCDSVDGVLSEEVFVAPSGVDTNPGSARRCRFGPSARGSRRRLQAGSRCSWRRGAMARRSR